MLDRQALFNQLLDYLQSTPDLPDYLGEEPDSAAPFDPYQMVSEWIALRQEMKQQGKLLQTAQERLQRELEAARSHNEDLQQRLEESQKQVSIQYAIEFAAQEKRFEKEQESLLRRVLNVMDALDRASAYWHDQESQPSISLLSDRSKPLREKLADWLLRLSQKLSSSEAKSSSISTSISTSTSASLVEILNSDRQGIELIRRNLLDLLKQQHVIPINAQGNPFDSQRMYAIGRQEDDAPENTVIQEVVRGYVWRDRVLREAQVIVSAGSRYVELIHSDP
ncbi:MAG: nucleotide exchange factor GrpE [Cyanobacteria bacterium RU_5_0]|nr:nucleotide exchange factor GrpE [Cyanobacteria bacterium RU_5_0]